MIDVRARLTAPDLAELVARLGFRGPDTAAVLAAAAAAGDDEHVHLIRTRAERLIAAIGDFAATDLEPRVEDADRAGAGVLPLLALVVTAPEVVRFHRSRGVPPEVSWRSLADLGQQVWVHRRTYGEFGLHTHEWLRIAWSGALFWLGRLQFNLQRKEGAWVLSTHIPDTGPLTPASVDASFGWAREFFARHFAEYRVDDFYCSSWLLDPQLARELPPAANLVHFQRRWRLYGEPMRGDDDALFFIFHRRGGVDLAALPRDTSLQRAIVDTLQGGGHWHVWQGRIPVRAGGADR